MDLPYWHGPAEVLHLMSFISMLDHDLAVIYAEMLPIRLSELLCDRGIACVEVPPEEFASQGCNVLALEPRRVLMLAGNPVTQRRLEAAGCEVQTYDGTEISLKGDGGPTCLTRPLKRSA
jgi:N-dimethylarginine dimethylaminohydrolase